MLKTKSHFCFGMIIQNIFIFFFLLLFTFSLPTAIQLISIVIIHSSFQTWFSFFGFLLLLVFKHRCGLDTKIHKCTISFLLIIKHLNLFNSKTKINSTTFQLNQLVPTPNMYTIYGFFFCLSLLLSLSLVRVFVLVSKKKAER